jgi:GNAT superfamily N-acetyltransferase
MEAVLRDSHEIWGTGMTREDYAALNRALRATPWGREHYRFLVGLDGAGEIASSLKLYSLRGELEGRPILVAGVGAVFTPSSRRGRGHAASLIEAALACARDRGHDLALLLSEIGGAYYERLGFRALPAQEAACMAFLPVPWPREPPWIGAGGDPLREIAGLRPGRPEDLESLVAVRDEATRGQRFRLLRGRRRWEHLLFQADLETRHRRDGADHRWVVERNGAVLAYAILKEGKGRLLWKEHGARLGSEGVLIDLFWAALALARRLGVGRIDAWHLPVAVTDGPLYPIARRPRREPVPMLRPLGADPLPSLAGVEECRISWLDAF